MKKKTIQNILVFLGFLACSMIVWLFVYAWDIPKFWEFTFNDELNKSSHLIVAFRNDDLSVFSNPEHEESIISLFRKHGIRQTFAFISEPGSYFSGLSGVSQRYDKTIELLRIWVSEGIIELALHGYSHEKNQGSSGEFDKLPYENQKRMIREAKDLMDRTLGTKVRMFVPPWNQADKNTILACQQAGINIFSSFLGNLPLPGMAFLGVNAALFPDGEEVPDARRVIEIARASKRTTLVVILYHSLYDFSDSSRTASLSALLDSLSADPQVEIMSLGQIVEQYPRLVEEYNAAGYSIIQAKQSFYWAKPYNKCAKILSSIMRGELSEEKLLERAYHEFWRGSFKETAYLARAVYKKCKFYVRVGRTCLSLLGFIFGAIIISGSRHMDRRKKNALWTYLGGFMLLVILLVSAFHFIHPYNIRWLIEFGISITLLVCGLFLFNAIFYLRMTYRVGKIERADQSFSTKSDD